MNGNYHLIVMGVIAAIGLIQAIINKPLFVSTSKYTPDSLAKFARPAGVLIFLTGLSGLAFLYEMGKDFGSTLMLVALVVFVVCIIAYIVICKKILKKEAGR